MDIYEKIEKGKIKGYLTIKKRISYEGAIYHVTQRAPGKELIFIEENDHLYFLKILKEISHKFSLEIYSFALLPNHLHLLLQTTEKNISSSMKNLFERYAIFFNKKYERKGHVFCGNFRASLCNDEIYLLTVSVYIHLNPLRAGLCGDAIDYRWTSLRLYLNTDKDSFINYRKILSLLNSDIQKASSQYHVILSNSMKDKRKNLLDYRDIKRDIKEELQTVEEIVKTKPTKLDKKINQLKDKKHLRNPASQKARRYLIKQLLANGYGRDEVMRKLAISRATYFRIATNCKPPK